MKGYLEEGSGAQLKADCIARNVPFEVPHTSGHASVTDLKRLAAAVSPKALVPIHTFGAEQLPELFDNVTLVGNGEWFEI
jgi:ribonuclease J